MRSDERDHVDRPDADELFRSLLEGLRTTLPGSQVLLAFLLTVPLQAGFGDLDDVSKSAYLVALIATALAAVLFIAPTAHARVRYPVSGLQRRTERHVEQAGYMALAGTVSLAIGLTSAMFLSVYILLNSLWASIVAGVVGATAVVTWFVVPIWWTLRGD